MQTYDSVHQGDPIIYRRGDTLFVLKDEEMRTYFASCEGGLPEAPLIDWAWDTFQPKSFVDVGAHVGTWSHMFASHGTRVIAFEPNHEIAKLWKASCSLNDCDEIAALHEFACVDSTQYRMWATLTVPHADGGGGSIVAAAGPDAECQAVWLTTVDWYTIPSVDLIKIDAEGAELDVLKGAKMTIDRCKPRIIFECWETEKGQRKEELFKYLHDELEYDVQPVSWADTYLAEPRT